MNDIVAQAETILQDIANEPDPLKCCLHYRKAADLLPELLEFIDTIRIKYFFEKRIRVYDSGAKFPTLKELNEYVKCEMLNEGILFPDD
jgi:hypothetical protein